MRTLLSSSTALLLPILAAAYDPTTGSSAQGNLSLHAPYNLNPSTFDEATSSPDTSGAFNITGYNISSTTPTPQSTTGWKLTARVTYDVSLNSSSFFEATTLYLETPTGMTMDDNTWKICAVVFTGAQGSGQTVDGTCNGVLSGSCFQALNVAGTGGSSGMDANGACGQFSVPEACAGDFPAGTGNVSAISVNQTVLDAHRFYAFGSALTSKGNETAQTEAQENVWPVMLIYGHFSEGGQRSSSNAAMQCVRAVNGTTDDDLPGSAAASLRSAMDGMLLKGVTLTMTVWMLLV